MTDYAIHRNYQVYLARRTREIDGQLRYPALISISSPADDGADYMTIEEARAFVRWLNTQVEKAALAMPQFERSCQSYQDISNIFGSQQTDEKQTPLMGTSEMAG